MSFSHLSTLKGWEFWQNITPEFPVLWPGADEAIRR